MRAARILAFSVVCAGVMSSTSAALAEESAAPMRYPPSSVRPKLLAGGLVVTGIGYGAAAITASLASDLPGASEMQIPIAGPWMSLGKMACPADEPDCGASLYIRGVLTVIDGLMQLGGLGIAAEGLFMKTEASAPADEKKQAIWIRPAPIVTSTTTGFGVVGTF